MITLPRFLFILLLIPLFFSCETDFDVNGKYEDVPVVYGILDPSTSTQYIRINRAFLGEGNAYLFAQVPDSTIYPYLLDVKVEAYNDGGNLMKTYVCDTVHLFQSSSVFYNGYMPFYRFQIPFSDATVDHFTKDTSWLNKDYIYKLKIYNPVKQKYIEAQTPLIGKPSITKPSTSSKYISFSTNNTSAVEWISALNGKRYDIAFKFHYIEVYPSHPTDSIHKSVTWNIGSIKSEKLIGGENLSLNYSNWGLYSKIKNTVPVIDTVERYPGNIDLIFTMATDELSTYLDVNGPSAGLIQEKPLYTNLENAVGIFAARSYKRSIYKLNYQSVQVLMFGDDTKNLRFHDYPNVP